MNIIKEIKNVINTEISALCDLKSSINKNFEKAVCCIHKSKGKVVVTGVGKSGIIAKKISSTMSSTGTPAIFLHSSEAVHGDLGTVCRQDIILIISKSGESSEILDILPVLKKIGTKIIVITSNNNSYLAKNADILLHTPIKKEACHLGLAPTSSTTVALVIGDSLAITLMKLRNFKSSDFALFHPGGQLGKRLLFTVSDVMRKGTNNPIININKSVKNLLLEITKKKAGAISVIDSKYNLLGLVTDYDIRKVLNTKSIFEFKIKDIMNKKPKYVYDNEKAINILRYMENEKKPFSVVPVLNKKTKKVVGMIHLHDILSAGI